MSAPNTIELQDLVAREAIRDCLYRYCRGIDRADAEMLRSAYWPDNGFWPATPKSCFRERAAWNFWRRSEFASA